jgi:hypothetical protein
MCYFLATRHDLPVRPRGSGHSYAPADGVEGIIFSPEAATSRIGNYPDYMRRYRRVSRLPKVHLAGGQNLAERRRKVL